MAKYIAIAAMTLDGKIATDKNQLSFDWTSEEDKNWFKQSIKPADIVIIGRHTFDTIKSRRPKRNYLVLTSRVKKLEEKFPNVWFCNPKTVNIHQLVAKNKYKHVAIVGGSIVYGYFLEKGWLDELYLTLEPLTFGGGIGLFATKKIKKYNFQLAWVKKLNKRGTLLLKYKKLN
jgi:dihydrofolate reductase